MGFGAVDISSCRVLGIVCWFLPQQDSGGDKTKLWALEFMCDVVGFRFSRFYGSCQGHSNDEIAAYSFHNMSETQSVNILGASDESPQVAFSFFLSSLCFHIPSGAPSSGFMTIFVSPTHQLSQQICRPRRFPTAALLQSESCQNNKVLCF